MPDCSRLCFFLLLLTSTPVCRVVVVATIDNKLTQMATIVNNNDLTKCLMRSGSLSFNVAHGLTNPCHEEYTIKICSFLKRLWVTYDVRWLEIREIEPKWWQSRCLDKPNLKNALTTYMINRYHKGYNFEAQQPRRETLRKFLRNRRFFSRKTNHKPIIT